MAFAVAGFSVASADIPNTSVLEDTQPDAAGRRVYPKTSGISYRIYILFCLEMRLFVLLQSKTMSFSVFLEHDTVRIIFEVAALAEYGSPGGGSLISCSIVNRKIHSFCSKC